MAINTIAIKDIWSDFYYVYMHYTLINMYKNSGLYAYYTLG